MCQLCPNLISYTSFIDGIAEHHIAHILLVYNVFTLSHLFFQLRCFLHGITKASNDYEDKHKKKYKYKYKYIYSFMIWFFGSFCLCFVELAQ